MQYWVSANSLILMVLLSLCRRISSFVRKINWCNLLENGSKTIARMSVCVVCMGVYVREKRLRQMCKMLITKKSGWHKDGSSLYCLVNFNEDLKLFQNRKFKRTRKNKDINVAWSPRVFMITSISGLTRHTPPKTPHFFLFLNYKGFIPLSTHIWKIPYSTKCLWESPLYFKMFCKSVLVVTFCTN